MKNITVSIPDDVYKKARIYAAEQDTSISAIVRDVLTNLREQHARFLRLQHMEQEVVASIKDFSAEDRLDRETLHDRHAVR